MQKLFAILLFSLTVSIISAQSKSTHTVVKGETIYAIAKQYHVTVEALEKANKATLGENFKLKIGQKLIIPVGSSKTETKSEKPATAAAPKAEKPAAATAKKDKPEATKPLKTTKPEPQTAPAPAGEPSIHIVTKGETVYAIAKANGLTWRQIKDANHLSDDMKLKLGQKLILPSKNPDAMYKPVAKDAEAETKPAPKTEVAKTTEQGKDYLTAKPAEIKKPEPAVKSNAETIPQIKAEPAESKPAPAPAKIEKVKETPGMKIHSFQDRQMLLNLHPRKL